MDEIRTVRGDGAAGGLDELVAGFCWYLSQERALAVATTTVQNYLNQVRPFVTWCTLQGRDTVAGLTTGEVNRFLAWRSRSCSAGSMTVVCTALRTWLRWLFLAGHLDQQLAEGVGPVRYSGLTGIPKALSVAELRALLDVEASPRDRALVLLLARLRAALGGGRRARAGGCELARRNGAHHR